MHSCGNKKQRCYIYLLFFLFYAWLSMNIPFTADDWGWGTDTGIDWLINATQNSRYAGNTFVVIMTRSKFLNMIIMAFVSCLIPYLITKVATKNCEEDIYQSLIFVCSNVLFLAARPSIWSETNGWIAGFANFVISAVFVLIQFIEWIPLILPDDKVKNDTVCSCILMFVCSLVGQLFIENLSIVMMVFAVTAFYTHIYVKRKVSWKYLMMALGTIIGLIIMFSSSIYGTLFREGNALNGYRQILFLSQNNLFRLIYAVINQCARLVLRIGQENIGITISILLVLALHIHFLPQKRFNKILIIVNSILCVYYLAVLFFNVRYNEETITTAMIAAVINLLFVLLVCGELLYLYHHKKSEMLLVIILWFAALFTLCPLVLTSENGCRLFYTYEVIAIIMVAILLYQLLQLCSFDMLKKLLCLAMISAVMLSMRYVVIYSANSSCERLRMELIADAIADNTKTIILPQFPYKAYAGRSTPISDEAIESFKYFYNIPEDINVYFE